MQIDATPTVFATESTSAASGSPSKLGTTLQSQFLWKCLNSPAVLRVW